MAEFYPAELVRRSRALWDDVRRWGTRRHDVTGLGGWAVYELVDPAYAYQSKDVDILLHSQAALDDFETRLREWNLTWRQKGRTRFKDCHFTGDPERRIVVDVFTTDSSIGAWRFKMQKATNVKPAVWEGFVPGVPFLLRDKVETIPRRAGWDDPAAKRLKDFLDVRALAYHNRAGIGWADLADQVPKASRSAALEWVAPTETLFPSYADELAEVRRWLNRPGQPR